MEAACSIIASHVSSNLLRIVFIGFSHSNAILMLEGDTDHVVIRRN